MLQRETAVPRRYPSVAEFSQHFLPRHTLFRWRNNAKRPYRQERPAHFVFNHVHAMILLRSFFGTRKPNASSGWGTSSRRNTQVQISLPCGMPASKFTHPSVVGSYQRCRMIGATSQNDRSNGRHSPATRKPQKPSSARGDATPPATATTVTRDFNSVISEPMPRSQRSENRLSSAQPSLVRMTRVPTTLPYAARIPRISAARWRRSDCRATRRTRPPSSGSAR